MPYITAQEYIDRYGEAETIRLTDEDRSRIIDTAKLVEAISDATDIVDGYVSKRYAIPLVPPPRLVKGATGVLAREILYRNVAPQVVVDEADRARAMLKDISRGVMLLPGFDGPVEGRDAAGLSETSGDGARPVFTDESMSGFGAGPDGYVANWRR